MSPLSNQKTNQTLEIKGFSSEDPNQLSMRLQELGLLIGEKICIVHKAPIFGNPILIDVRGSRLALTKEEAKVILVENV